MPAKLTLELWIKRSNIAHNNRYDYSLSNYMNRDTEITIICPDHGSFKQHPGNHMRGKGCAECAPNTRMTHVSFVQKAKVIHADKYDYSVTKFTKNAAKLWIRCGVHGLFEQEANSHLMGAGCPDCADIARSVAVSNHPTRSASIEKTVMERYGVSNVMRVSAYKQKLVDTMLERYGVTNYRHSAQYNDKYKATVFEKYGVDHYSKSPGFSKQVMDTCLERYGVSNYTKSEEYNLRLPVILAKSATSQLDRYGAKHYSQSDIARELMPGRLEQGYATKRKNNSFSTSKPESRMFDVLCEIFGENDIERQYKDARYPFMCDFYIKSRDLFIELNATWTHGGRWYGSDEIVDARLLNVWRMKNTRYYDNAIQTWTVRDVNKRNTAALNDLNYVVFWSADLLDFTIWIDDGCPDGRDYILTNKK